LVLEIAPAPGRAAATASAPRLAAAHAAEEGVEEVGERIAVAEHLAHFFRRHRAEAAAGRAAGVHVPRAALCLVARSAGAGTGLLVHAPVGAKLVVLPALLGIAEDFVRLVDLLELRFGDLVVR